MCRQYDPWVRRDGSNPVAFRKTAAASLSFFFIVEGLTLRIGIVGSPITSKPAKTARMGSFGAGCFISRSRPTSLPLRHHHLSQPHRNLHWKIKDEQEGISSPPNSSHWCRPLPLLLSLILSSIATSRPPSAPVFIHIDGNFVTRSWLDRSLKELCRRAHLGSG